MPELPEVETVMRGMSAALSNAIIKDVEVFRSDLRVPIPQDFAKQVSGLSVTSLKRRGKYILLGVGYEFVVVLHLGMSGRVRIYEPTEQYDFLKHDHVCILTDNGGRVVYHDPRRFGMLYLLPANGWEAVKPFSQMGPEPVGGDSVHFTPENLFHVFQGKSSPIKSVLLDQRVVAGLGNIYVCEALYDSGIHPARSAKDVTREETVILCAAIRKVLERAIQAGGSTLKDYQHTDGSLGYFQYQFSVYDKAGQACGREGCDSKVLRIVQSGRSSFYCPGCQK